MNSSIPGGLFISLPALRYEIGYNFILGEPCGGKVFLNESCSLFESLPVHRFSGRRHILAAAIRDVLADSLAVAGDGNRIVGVEYCREVLL